MDITFARFRIARDIWENMEKVDKVEFVDVFEKKVNEEAEGKTEVKSEEKEPEVSTEEPKSAAEEVEVSKEETEDKSEPIAEEVLEERIQDKKE